MRAVQAALPARGRGCGGPGALSSLCVASGVPRPILRRALRTPPAPRGTPPRDRAAKGPPPVRTQRARQAPGFRPVAPDPESWLGQFSRGVARPTRVARTGQLSRFPGTGPGSPACLRPPNLGPRSRTLAEPSAGTGVAGNRHGAPREDGGWGRLQRRPPPSPWAPPVHLQGGPPEPAPAHAGRTAGVALSTAPRRGCGVTLLPVHTALFDYCFRLTAAHPSGPGGDRRLCLGNNSPPSRPGIEPQEICLKFNT